MRVSEASEGIRKIGHDVAWIRTEAPGAAVSDAVIARVGQLTIVDYGVTQGEEA